MRYKTWTGVIDDLCSLAFKLQLVPLYRCSLPLARSPFTLADSDAVIITISAVQSLQDLLTMKSFAFLFVLTVVVTASAANQIPRLNINNPTSDWPWWLKKMMLRLGEEEEEEKAPAARDIETGPQPTDPTAILRAAEAHQAKAKTLLETYERIVSGQVRRKR